MVACGDNLAQMVASVDNLLCFIVFFFTKEEILAGNRPQGIFTRIGWKNIAATGLG
ncbi:hypothetical protein ACJX0J_019331, partial [Zea mays]